MYYVTRTVTERARSSYLDLNRRSSTSLGVYYQRSYSDIIEVIWIHYIIEVIGLYIKLPLLVIAVKVRVRCAVCNSS